jgi:hypothetical protein
MAAAPDWYPDPEDASRLRYWNGSEWTTYTHVRLVDAPSDFDVAIEQAGRRLDAEAARQVDEAARRKRDVQRFEEAVGKFLGEMRRRGYPSTTRIEHQSQRNFRRITGRKSFSVETHVEAGWVIPHRGAPSDSFLTKDGRLFRRNLEEYRYYHAVRTEDLWLELVGSPYFVDGLAELIAQQRSRAK